MLADLNDSELRKWRLPRVNLIPIVNRRQTLDMRRPYLYAHTRKGKDVT